jgi:hypothetical protein
MSEEYEFRNIPIKPDIIEKLILQKFNGTVEKRENISRIILELHLNYGGLRPLAKDFNGQVKKALTNLKDKGKASSRASGYWEINDNTTTNLDNSDLVSNYEPKQEESIKISVNTVYGNGANAVYLYYFSNYMEFSILHDKSTWACKIGRTNGDTIARILSQSATAFPEKPTIDFVIKTNDPKDLESMIHSALKLRGRHIKDAPGVEWFDTNPNEVIEIVKAINTDLLF